MSRDSSNDLTFVCYVAVCCRVLQCVAIPVWDTSFIAIVSRDSSNESCVKDYKTDFVIVTHGITPYSTLWLYGVATISRLLRIIGLFCKRAL